jgi:hypothetical protein
MHPHQQRSPTSRTLATITALPWLVIWIAALITLLGKNASDVPFEYPLALVLTITCPLVAWYFFRR